MDPWSKDAAWPAAKKSRKRITLPKTPKPPPRDALARPLGTIRELGEFVGEIRLGLSIPQAALAARAGVSRQWLVALESGRQTVEAGKVLQTLEALGFEIVVTPYDPPPPWMMRALVGGGAEAGGPGEGGAGAAQHRPTGAGAAVAAGGELPG